MDKEKMISAFSTIDRALGMIEGVSSGLEKAYADTLIDAVEMIDYAMGVIKDGN